MPDDTEGHLAADAVAETLLTPAGAARILRELGPAIVKGINDFAQETFVTRGGRIGSGMGTVLEALWGYFANQHLRVSKTGCEIGWMADHDYNDFACVRQDTVWDPITRAGELLRIEVKSMNAGADESKAHFDELISDLKHEDLLLVFVWSWKAIDGLRYSPYISDFFLGHARPIARLRDALHIARGGTFVRAGLCPDNCEENLCSHVGEPLNASQKRERGSGPKSTKPANVLFAANFGGLVRMIQTSSPQARAVFQTLRRESDAAHEYINFIHRNYPEEEKNRYTQAEWKQLAKKLGIDQKGLKAADRLKAIREAEADYRRHLRDLRITQDI